MAEDIPARIQETVVGPGAEWRRRTADSLCSSWLCNLAGGGKRKKPSIWNHRPFFLQFGDDDRRVRTSTHTKSCAHVLASRLKGIERKLIRTPHDDSLETEA
jgi:hypothetical protein